MEVLALIPARAGSKGIIDKNIKELMGHPLMAYSIAVAKICPEVTRVIVSTDSERYREIAESYGAEVPFLRPAEISGSDSLDIEYLQFTLKELKRQEGYNPDYVLLLRPTTPLRTPIFLSDALKMLINNSDATAVVSVSEMDVCPYKWAGVSNEGYLEGLFKNFEVDDVNLPRQSFPKVYEPNGYVDVLKPKVLLERKMMYGERALTIMTDERVIDIDLPEDFEYVMNEKMKAKKLLDYLNSIS